MGIFKNAKLEIYIWRDKYVFIHTYINIQREERERTAEETFNEAI